MYFDPLYWIIIGAGMLLGLWAQARVKSAFAKYSKIGTRSGMTGAQVAANILRENGIHDVKIEPVQGRLSDHYDPRKKMLRLSPEVYQGRSLAAFGIAAHEVGHAIQHAQDYAPLRFRSAWVPIANTGGGLSFIVIIAALLLGGAASALGLALVGVGLFATTTIFTLVTLPVEFDASKRALATLQQGAYMGSDELVGAKKVLDAAAMTYVAAFVSSALTLIYYIMLLFGGNRN